MISSFPVVAGCSVFRGWSDPVCLHFNRARHRYISMQERPGRCISVQGKTEPVYTDARGAPGRCISIQGKTEPVYTDIGEAGASVYRCSGRWDRCISIQREDRAGVYLRSDGVPKTSVLQS